MVRVRIVKDYKTPITHCVIYMVLFKCKHRRDFMIIEYWRKHNTPHFDSQMIYLQKELTKKFRTSKFVKFEVIRTILERYDHDLCMKCGTKLILKPRNSFELPKSYCQVCDEFSPNDEDLLIQKLIEIIRE